MDALQQSICLVRHYGYQRQGFRLVVGCHWGHSPPSSPSAGLQPPLAVSILYGGTHQIAYTGHDRRHPVIMEAVVRVESIESKTMDYKYCKGKFSKIVTDDPAVTKIEKQLLLRAA